MQGVRKEYVVDPKADAYFDVELDFSGGKTTVLTCDGCGRVFFDRPIRTDMDRRLFQSAYKDAEFHQYDDCGPVTLRRPVPRQ